MGQCGRINVLASGSGGNCSVVEFACASSAGGRRVVMIDAGLSPRRTARELGEVGLRIEDIDDVVLTHPDTDHLHGGWARRGLPGTFRLHKRHTGLAARMGFLTGGRSEPFGDGSGEGAALGSVRMVFVVGDHDEHGSCAMRFECSGGGTLGFATDLGRVRGDVAACLERVDTLAVESNYCVEMLEGSDRPAFLKRRISGGSGHLSNDECVELCGKADPRASVVLLHLSRECNTREKALAGHTARGYASIAASQVEQTGWIGVEASSRDSRGGVVVRQLGLFGDRATA